MNNSMLTTYSKDYAYKKPNHEKCPPQPSEFQDPIAASFQHYLELGISGKATTVEPNEVVGDYLTKFQTLYPKIGTVYFNHPIRQSAIDRTFEMDKQSTYQQDYCDNERDNAVKVHLESLKKMKLPHDWAIPLTTQASSYRQPSTMGDKSVLPREPCWPKDAIVTDKNVNKILRVKAGQSEYSRLINELGTTIVEGQLHGKIVHSKIGLVPNS